MLTLTRTLSTHAAALNHTRTCIPGTYMQAWHANKAYLYPRSRGHGSNIHAHARRSPQCCPVVAGTFCFLAAPAVARDHAQHSATPTPCRTRRITADRAHHAAGHQLAAPRQQPRARVATASSKPSALAGLCPASSPAPSSTAPRLAALARPLLQPRPIKGGAELSIPATQSSPPLASHLALALLLPLHCPRSRALPCEGETP